MFLIGFALGKTGYFRQLLDKRSMLWWIAGTGFIVGVPFNYLLALLMEEFPGTYYGLRYEGWLRTLVYALGVAPLALAYVASLALAYGTLAGRQVLLRVAPVGKMAFSNYISHSLIAIIVFNGIGLGLMGRFGAVALLAFAVSVFFLQVLLSTLWLRLFEYGPLEWVWRSLTYGKAQPFRRTTAS